MANKNYKNITILRICELLGNDSQGEFADKIGFAQPTISRMFTEDKTPSSSVLLAVAKYYNVSVDWLLGLSERKELGGSVQAHNITSSNLTYADAMSVLELLYKKGCLEVGYEPNGYNPEPDPGIMWVKDKVLRYFLDNRLRYSGGSRNIYNIWLKDALEQYSKLKIISWTDYINTAYEQNISDPPSDDEIIKLVQDIFSGNVEPDMSKQDGFMNIPDELPFQ